VLLVDDQGDWRGWLRIDGERLWRCVAAATSAVAAYHAISEYLAALCDPPKHVESYVGKVGRKPPMPRISE